MGRVRSQGLREAVRRVEWLARHDRRELRRVQARTGKFLNLVAQWRLEQPEQYQHLVEATK